MTREEFLTALRETPAEGWRAGVWIRRTAGRVEDCPITAVCAARTGLRHGQTQYGVAAQQIGLPVREAERIAMAADGMPRHSKALREALLDATVRRTR